MTKLSIFSKPDEVLTAPERPAESPYQPLQIITADYFPGAEDDVSQVDSRRASINFERRSSAGSGGFEGPRRFHKEAVVLGVQPPAGTLPAPVFKAVPEYRMQRVAPMPIPQAPANPLSMGHRPLPPAQRLTPQYTFAPMPHPNQQQLAFPRMPNGSWSPMPAARASPQGYSGVPRPPIPQAMQRSATFVPSASPQMAPMQRIATFVPSASPQMAPMHLHRTASFVPQGTASFVPQRVNTFAHHAPQGGMQIGRVLSFAPNYTPAVGDDISHEMRLQEMRKAVQCS